MKKIVIAVLIVLVTILLLSSVIMAQTIYIVKKGDYLSVIGKRLNVNWQEIAKTNGIEKPWIIHPKQKLIIPENEDSGRKYLVKKEDSIYEIAVKIFHIPWSDVRLEMRKKKIIHPGQQFTLSDLLDLTKEKIWKKFNIQPFKKFSASSEKQLKRDKRGLEILGLSEKQIKEVMRKHKKAVKGSQEGFRWDAIKTGDKFDKVLFGEFYLWRNIGVDWGTEQQATRVYKLSSGIEVWYPIICGNWFPVAKVKKPEFPLIPAFESKPEFPLVPAFESKPDFPPVPVFASQKEGLAVHNNFDFYMGGGMYESVHYDAKGDYWWAKARYRPFAFQIGESLELDLGLFAFGAMGDGNDGHYDYSWRKWAIGPTAKLIGNHWDADVDAGIGRLYNKGKIDLYRSKQIDDIFLFSAHGNFYSRRDKGEKWFPKTELNFELTLPYNNHHRHSWDGDPLIPDPNDNRSFELSLTQGIYDFNLNKHLRLTPGFNLGFTHEYGRDDPNFLQFGPMSVLSWYNEDIISVSVLNYKKNLGGNGDQRHWLSGWLSLSGIYKTYGSSQITEATDEDLKF